MVKVTILDEDQNLKPEMSARVTFLEVPKTGAAAAVPASLVLLPQQAVITRDGRTQVFEVAGERARARPVRLGPPQRDQVVIAEGLAGGEVVIVAPPAELKDGDPVRVKPA
jgi:multidrug efflux pump subunit AcrA (membrane-fusion protein)